MNIIGKIGLVGLGLIAAAGLINTAAPRAADKIKISLLLPCTKCADRWETKDRPFITDLVKKLDPNIEVIAANAEGDGNRQVAQGEAALAQGVKAFIINTMGESAAAPIVRAAHKEHVPVIAYDGLIKGVVTEGYVSFNNVKVGEMQAQYVLDHVKPGANVALINGEQFCSACRDFKVGAHNILDPAVKAGKIKLVYEAETIGWLTTNAQREVEQALTANNDNIEGIVAANDTLAQGVIAALRSRKLAGKVVITGQDASDAAIEHILAGEQSMTVYKALQDEATAAAKAAVMLVHGQDVSSMFAEKTPTDAGDQPSLLLKPTVVDISNIGSTVIKDGFTKKENVCKGEAAAKCNF